MRYIHLNPLRANMVKNMSELDRYPWSGHSAIMGRKKMEWQDIDYVLSWFGKSKYNARKAYRRYMVEGIKDGRREDLVGGGLIRTLGGWSQVISLRQSKDKVLSDERVLGQDQFVERILSETDNRIIGQLSINERKIGAEKKILEVCRKEGVNIEELKGGSRRDNLSKIRAKLVLELVEENGLTLAETARQLGVSTSAVSKIFERNRKI